MELMVTMSIAIILSMTGIPGFREYQRNQAIRSAVTLLHSDLNLARNDAISLNSQTVACPGNATTGCAGHARWAAGWLIFADLNGDQAHQGGEPVLRQAMAIDGLSVLGAASRSMIRFFPGGTAPGSNTSIVFCDQRGPSSGKKLVISNSGRIRRSGLTDADNPLCRGS